MNNDPGDEHADSPRREPDGIVYDAVKDRHEVWVGGHLLGSFAMRSIAASVFKRETGDEAQAAPVTLDEWWRTKNADDIERTAPKIAEYGSHGSGSGDIDLMAQCFKMLRPDLSDEVCIELSLAFYLQGKVARIFSSLSRNKLANEDSWFDARIYTIMAQSIRERGHWG